MPAADSVVDALGAALPIGAGTPDGTPLLAPAITVLLGLFAGVVPVGGTPAPWALAWDATGAGLGKNVALFPLKTCHWSHSKTIEKPKITHKTVRRMSFMSFSFQERMASNV